MKKMRKVCSICGANITDLQTLAVTCSSKCRQKAYRARQRENALRRIAITSKGKKEAMERVRERLKRARQG